MSYVANNLMGLDMFLSTLTGGLPGETLSGRTGSNWLKGNLRGRIFCAPIDVFMWLCRQYPTPRGHCVAAIDGDIQRAKAIIASQQH